MDCFAVTNAGILIHYKNCVATMSVDNGAARHDGYIGDLVITNALNINTAVSCCNNAHIIACNTTICASINLRTNFSCAIMCGYRICCGCGVYAVRWC